MAENKKSFILYCDIIHTVKKLPKDKQADLFVHILEYVNDMNPKTDDFVVEIAFEPIKQALKRDLEKYEKIKQRNAENGKTGGRPKKAIEDEQVESVKENKPKKPSGLIGNPKNPSEPKKADIGIGIDSVIDIGIESDIEKEKTKDINIVSHETKTNNEAFEKFNKWVDENATNVRRIKNQITEEQFTKLKEKYNSQQIMQIILNLENYKDAPKKYTSVYLTVNNWIKNEPSNKSYGERNTKVPAAGSREAKEQSRRSLVKLADQILGIDESENGGRSFR